ncbi:peptide-methionine (S)-S-oxide reductase MsrA [Rubritalea tangerina]|uniref:Peptide methionine sulfoxide reductase MsrA n=1 Tax=Rubritalea tangerina TaxID=430798 RepID=A0ABW4Z9V5_9BACT
MKIKPFLYLAAVAAIAFTYFSNQTLMSADKSPAKMPTVPEGHQQISLGAGCFWCVEAIYNRLDGIKSAVSGYTGGSLKNPTYKDICTGATGHAEVVHLVYDPNKISTETILEWFWKAHDPTTLNRQGNDVGTQYRSAIYYYTEEQKNAAKASMQAAQKDFKSPIVTEITKATTFYPAEVYHQDYYKINGKKNGYCRMIIAPKMKKLGLENAKKVAE